MDEGDRPIRQAEAAFWKLEQLKSLRERDLASLQNWERTALRRFEKCEPQLLLECEAARAQMREMKEGMQLIMEPVWAHVAASPEPKWAAVARSKPKAFRNSGALVLTHLAYFVTGKQEAEIALQLLKRLQAGTVEAEALTATRLRKLQAACIKHGIDPVLQLRRKGLQATLERLREMEEAAQARLQLSELGTLLAKTPGYQIRLRPPQDLEILGAWMGNCVGSQPGYKRLAELKLNAILVACPSRGSDPGLPAAMVEVRPQWGGSFLRVGWASRFKQGEDPESEAQDALRVFLSRKTAVSQIGRSLLLPTA